MFWVKNHSLYPAHELLEVKQDFFGRISSDWLGQLAHMIRYTWLLFGRRGLVL